MKNEEFCIKNDELCSLFLVGSFTIGKEKVMLALSKALGKQIYVEPPKHKILSQLEMPPEDFERFTTDASSTNLGQFSMEAS